MSTSSWQRQDTDFQGSGASHLRQPATIRDKLRRRVVSASVGMTIVSFRFIFIRRMAKGVRGQSPLWRNGVEIGSPL
jgi:hypothetical protein